MNCDATLPCSLRRTGAAAVFSLHDAAREPWTRQAARLLAEAWSLLPLVDDRTAWLLGSFRKHSAMRPAGAE